MKNNKFLLNTIFTLVLFAALAIAMTLRIFFPALVIPPLNVRNLVLLSLAALLLEYFIAPCNQRCYACVTILGVLACGALPLMAGFACVHTFVNLGLVGGIIFTATTFVFSSMTERLRTGPKARGAVLMGALGIYLAAQCFAGILL